jgi:hypothetical protein
MWHWPGPYHPTREVYSAIGCIVFVLIWLSWAILTGILVTIAATVIYKCTREWWYAVVLGVCGWLPCLLLGTILFWAFIKMAQGFQAAVVLDRRQREQRWLRRRRERQREQIQVREFNATMRALAVPGVEPFVEAFSGPGLEGSQASMVETAGT